jgi:hypothetical protein
MEGFRIDPAEAFEPERVLFCDDLRVEFDLYDTEMEGDYELRVGPFQTSTAESALVIDRLSYRALHTDEEYLQGGGPPGDRFDITAGPIRLDGIDYWRILESLEIAVEHASVESLHIDVLSDKQRSEAEGPPPAIMPHDLVQQLPIPVTVEQLDIRDSRVLYRERGEKSVLTGSISFENINGTVTSLSNDPARMTRETPAVIRVSAELQGQGGLEARIEVPLLAPAPTMKVWGEAGAFDAELLNTMLPAIEGVRFTSGRLDTAWLEISFGPERAVGSVIPVFRDVRIRTESRETGDQDLGNVIVSFAANTFVLRKDNQPRADKPPRAGKVDYRIKPGDPFFKIFWEAIRDGLISAARK